MFDILYDYGLILLIGEYLYGLLGGLVMILILVVVVLLLLFLLVVLVGIGCILLICFVLCLVGLYVNMVCGLLLLLLVFWLYFVVLMLFGKSINVSLVMLVVLVIYESVYLGEIVKVGIQVLLCGQMEVVCMLGMGYWIMLCKVILLQVLFNMILSMMNQFVVVVKNILLVYVIGVDELINVVYQVNSQLLIKLFEVYVLLVMMYFVVCFVLSCVVVVFEQCIVWICCSCFV